jgi:hypothetical protein
MALTLMLIPLIDRDGVFFIRSNEADGGEMNWQEISAASVR